MMYSFSGRATLGVLVTAILVGLGFVLVHGLPLGSAHGDQEDVAEVVVIYAEDDDTDQFLDGVRLGVEEVNRAGGLAGTPLRLRLVAESGYTENVDLQETVAGSMELATQVSSDPDVVAVIGHSSSSTAVPASAVYNRNKKLFLATHATATSLSNHGFDYVFSLQPNNADNASLMADYALGQGMRRFVVLTDDTSYGVETTDRFASFVAQGGAELLYRGALTSHGRSIDRLLMFLLDNAVFEPDEIDAIFITTSSYADAARFIRRARALNLTMPILGPELLFARTIEEAAGPQNMRGVAAVSLYDLDSRHKERVEFSKAYMRATEQTPYHLAALGYDAIRLLAFAAEKAGTLDSRALADTLRILRYQEPYVGAAGSFAFDADGLVTDTDAFIVLHDGTSFQTVDGVRIQRQWTSVRERSQK